MNKRIGLKVLGGAVVAVATFLLIPSVPNGSNAMEPTIEIAKTPTEPLAVAPARALPPIDQAAPQKFETATFALG